jgi:polysaccharide export outer membrane protein
MKKIVCIILILVAAAAVRADDQLHKRERYTLRPGDSFDLKYRLTPEFNQTVIVQPDGFVNLTMVGDIKVGGLSVEEVHDLVVEKASKRLNNPEVNIVLKEFNKPYVVVAGEVERPGRIDLREDTTAMQAILLAGGFKASGYDTSVYLFRRINGGDAEVRKLNLHNLEKTKDLERDMMLRAGDMLLVPRNKLEKFSRIVKAANLGVYFNPLDIKP